MLFDDEVAKYGDIVSRTNANGEKEYYLQYVVEEVVDGKLVKTVKEIPLGTDISKYSKDDIINVPEDFEGFRCPEAERYTYDPYLESNIFNRFFFLITKSNSLA